MTTKKSDEAFLSRWSRRKRGGETEPEADREEEKGQAAARGEAAPPAAPKGEAAEESAPALTEEDVEKLGPGSDYSVFMKKGVAPHIQRLALRKLWRSNPVLANLDGLVDYNDDYRTVADAGEVVSSWKVGKGIAKIAEGGDEAGDDQVPEEVAENVSGAATDGETGQGGNEDRSDSATDGGDETERA